MAQAQQSELRARAPTVHCAAGSVAGVPEGDLDVFRGIPYARPPTGPRRFRPAEPMPRWPGVLDATRFGPASAQVFDAVDADWDDLGGVGPPGDWVGDEDSLTLNIWAPATAAAPRPVIVFIHGGANWLESSRLPIYSGDAFARGGAVFVSLNYRLGVFGFLDLAPIGGPVGAHSHGLTDQATALAWVVANIAAFGGDPANITLMGGSAGAMDIGWLLAAGLLPRGVRRLVLMSGVASVVGLGWDGTRSAHAAAEGAARAAEFLARLGYTRFDEVAAAPTAEILSRHATLARDADILFDQDTLFYPRVGASVPRDPFAAARAGAAAGLDVMIGFTAYEMGLWLAWDDDLDRRGLDWAAVAMPFLPEAVRAALPTCYRAWCPTEVEGVCAMHLLGDAMFAMPSLWLADGMASGGARVFAYRFDWRADARRRALHAADVAFMLDRQATPAGEAFLGTFGNARERCALAEAMLQAALAFARTGDPSTPARAWPRYDGARAMMVFDVQPQVVADPMRERRAWWTANVLPRHLGGGA